MNKERFNHAIKVLRNVSNEEAIIQITNYVGVLQGQIAELQDKIKLIIDGRNKTIIEKNNEISLLKDKLHRCNLQLSELKKKNKDLDNKLYIYSTYNDQIEFTKEDEKTLFNI